MCIICSKNYNSKTKSIICFKCKKVKYFPDIPDLES